MTIRNHECDKMAAWICTQWDEQGKYRQERGPKGCPFSHLVGYVPDHGPPAVRAGATLTLCSLSERQCALAALRDVRRFLSDEGGHVAVSVPSGSAMGAHTHLPLSSGI